MSTVSTQDEVSPTKHTLQVVVVAAAVCVDLIAVILALVGAAPALGFLPLFTLPATLFLLGWGVTWLARRQAGRLLAGGRGSTTAARWPPAVGDPCRLPGAVRGHSARLRVRARGGLARSQRVLRPATVRRNRRHRITRAHLGEQASWVWGETPGWYPWLVVVREALVFMAALAIAWSVFARRPRHWMAYFVAGLVALGPLGDLGAIQSSRPLWAVWRRFLDSFCS